MPGGVVLLAVAALLASPAALDVAHALRSLLWVLFVAGIGLAWRFKRSTLALALMILGVMAVGLVVFTVDGGARDAFSILLPIDLALLAWLPERTLLGVGGWSRLGVVAGQVSAVALLTHPAFLPIAPAFASPLVPAWTARAGALGQPALLVFVLAIGVVTARALWVSRSEDGGLLWALVATGIALGHADAAMTTVWLAAAALVLVIATVEASYGLAYGDELTGLPSRRALDSRLRQLGGIYTIAMVDVDHFKKFNDEHGHPIGDQLLRMVAAQLGHVRAGGRAYRYGGEEFAVLFPGKGMGDVLDELETVRAAIEATPFVLRHADRPRKKPDRPVRGSSVSQRRVGVTVSIGVASATRRTTDPRAVLDAADAALYRAKHGGRNRISI